MVNNPCCIRCIQDGIDGGEAMLSVPEPKLWCIYTLYLLYALL
jgi:hypothetical protein